MRPELPLGVLCMLTVHASPRIDVFGDMAVVTYYSRGLWGREAGQMSYLKETNVLRKRDDGWKIVHVHVSR